MSDIDRVRPYVTPQPPVKGKGKNADEKTAKPDLPVLQGVFTEDIVLRPTPGSNFAIAPFHSTVGAYRAVTRFAGAELTRVRESITSPFAGLTSGFLPGWMSPAAEDMKSYSSRMLGSVSNYETLIGERVEVVHGFQQVYNQKSQSWLLAPTEMIDTVLDSGRIPMVTLEVNDLPARNYIVHDKNGYHVKTILQDIIDSKMDSSDPNNIAYYIYRYAQGMVKRGPVVIRLMHEMNGWWYPTSGISNGGGEDKVKLVYRDKDGNFQLIENDEQMRIAASQPGIPDGPERYIAAWIKIVKIFREAEKAAGLPADRHNVYFLWGPNAESVPRIPYNNLENYYPGDIWVDIIGVSLHKQDDDTTVDRLLSYWKAFLKGKNKALAFPEYSAGGNYRGAYAKNDQFYTDIYAAISDLQEHGYRFFTAAKFEIDKEQNWTFLNPTADPATGGWDYFRQLDAFRMAIGTGTAYHDSMGAMIETRANSDPLDIRRLIMDYRLSRMYGTAWDIVDMPFTDRRKDYIIGRVGNAAKKVNLLQSVRSEAMDAEQLDIQLGLSGIIVRGVDSLCASLKARAPYLGYVMTEIEKFKSGSGIEPDVAGLSMAERARRAALETLRDVILGLKPQDVNPGAIRSGALARAGKIESAITSALMSKASALVEEVLKKELDGLRGTTAKADLISKVTKELEALESKKASELTLTDLARIAALNRIKKYLTSPSLRISNVGSNFRTVIMSKKDQVVTALKASLGSIDLNGIITAAIKNESEKINPSASRLQPKGSYLAQLEILIKDISAKIDAESASSGKKGAGPSLEELCVEQSVLNYFAAALRASTRSDIDIDSVRAEALSRSGMDAIKYDFSRNRIIVADAQENRQIEIKKKDIIGKLMFFASVREDSKAYLNALYNIMRLSYEWIFKTQKESLSIVEEDIPAVCDLYAGRGSVKDADRARSITVAVCHRIIDFVDANVEKLLLLRDYEKDHKKAEAEYIKKHNITPEQFKIELAAAKFYYNTFRYTLPAFYGMKAAAHYHLALIAIDGESPAKLAEAESNIKKAEEALALKRENLSIGEEIGLIFVDGDFDLSEQIKFIRAVIKFLKVMGNRSDGALQQKMEAIYDMQGILRNEEVGSDLKGKIRTAIYNLILKDKKKTNRTELVPLAIEIYASPEVKFNEANEDFKSLLSAIK